MLTEQEYNEFLKEVAQTLGCEPADMVDTWIDAERQEESNICSYISNNHSEWKCIKTFEDDGRFGWTTNVYEIQEGVRVAIQYGMPDSFFYRREDEQLLLGTY